QRERLCLKTSHCGGQRVENTHDITSPTRCSTWQAPVHQDGLSPRTSQQSLCHDNYLAKSISYGDSPIASEGSDVPGSRQILPSGAPCERQVRCVLILRRA